MVETLVREKIKVISENILYKRAMDFINNNSLELEKLNTSQARGLENIARNATTLNEVEDFIKKQMSKGRDYNAFYKNLESEIGELKKVLVTEGIIASDLSKKEKKEQENLTGIFLVRDYIYHLVSEHVLRNNKKS